MDLTRCTCGEDPNHPWGCPGNPLLLDSQDSEESEESQRNQEHHNSEKDTAQAQYWIKTGIKDKEAQDFLDSLLDFEGPKKRPDKESQRNKDTKRAKRAEYWSGLGIKDKELTDFLDSFEDINKFRNKLSNTDLTGIIVGEVYTTSRLTQVLESSETRSITTQTIISGENCQSPCLSS